MSDTQAPAARTRTAPEAAAPAEAVQPVAEKAGKKAAATFSAKLVRGENYAIRHGGRTYRFKRDVEVADLPMSLKDVLADAADESTITDGDGSTETLRRDKFEIVG